MIQLPQKVLTAAQMNAVDRATIDAGIPGIILMENAAHRVVELLCEKFAPLSGQSVVIVCGKGNNGGDGLAVARLLHVRFQPRELYVVLLVPADQLTGDAATNLAMMRACGLEEYREFGPEMRGATLVVDAVLGTGLRGPATGLALNAIREINLSFRHAKVVAIDLPSGLSGDSAIPPGEFVRADATVTFTAPKVCHALPPARDFMGELQILPIGSPSSLYQADPAIQLALVTPRSIANIFAKRAPDSNKGRYGHVLLVAGSRGKAGAAAMAGLAALRSGAGLVTIACPADCLDAIAAFAPELMTVPFSDEATIRKLAATRTVAAIGPGIGTSDSTRTLVRNLFRDLPLPMVVDADALNCLAGTDWSGAGHLRILTPHPGEMARLAETTVPEIQADRLTAARSMATSRNVTLVLKGHGTLTAFPDGNVWVNPTGSPAMATGGTGDILTGTVAGLLAQFPNEPNFSTAAGVYLHGLAGELAAKHLSEQVVVATDLLHYYAEAIREISNLSY